MTKPLVSVFFALCFVIQLCNGKTVPRSSGRISKPHVSPKRKKNFHHARREAEHNASLMTTRVTLSYDSLFLDYPFGKKHRCQYSWINSRYHGTALQFSSIVSHNHPVQTLHIRTIPTHELYLLSQFLMLTYDVLC